MLFYFSRCHSFPAENMSPALIRITPDPHPSLPHIPTHTNPSVRSREMKSPPSPRSSFCDQQRVKVRSGLSRVDLECDGCCSAISDCVFLRLINFVVVVVVQSPLFLLGCEAFILADNHFSPPSSTFARAAKRQQFESGDNSNQQPSTEHFCCSSNSQRRCFKHAIPLTQLIVLVKVSLAKNCSWEKLEFWQLHLKCSNTGWKSFCYALRRRQDSYCWLFRPQPKDSDLQMDFCRLIFFVLNLFSV